MFVPLRRLALTLAVLAASPSVLAHPTSVTPDLRALFQQAVQGDTAHTDELEERFGRLSQQDPEDTVARAYHGASLTLQGRDGWLPWKRMARTEQGLDELDKALAQAGSTDRPGEHVGVTPELETRITAIGTFLGLPDLFHRLDAGRALVRQTLARADFVTAPAATRAQVFTWAAQAAHRSGDEAGAQRMRELARAEGGEAATR